MNYDPVNETPPVAKRRRHNQLGLLLWKNIKLQRRSLVGTLLEIFVPALFAIILLPIRQIVKSDQYRNDTTYRAFSLEMLPGDLTPHDTNRQVDSDSFDDLQWCFGYQPNNSTLLNAIMAQVAENLDFEMHCK